MQGIPWLVIAGKDNKILFTGHPQTMSYENLLDLVKQGQPTDNSVIKAKNPQKHGKELYCIQHEKTILE